MKSLKIGVKIWLGFACILVFLLAITGTTMVASVRTGANIDEVDVYVGMQNSANELIHILNETRVTAAAFYENRSSKSYGDLAKQLMYCDFRLSKLYEYVDAYPELASFRERVEAFDALYIQWHVGLDSLGEGYDLDAPLSEEEAAAFAESAGRLRNINLQAHEILSNTITHIGELSTRKTIETQSFHSVALVIVLAVSLVSLVSAVVLSGIIIRSITKPIGYMRDVLKQIGQTGNLALSEELDEALQEVAAGKDETAQCTQELLVMLDRMHKIDGFLARVAAGDLTADMTLQSKDDTMGLAVQKMQRNLNEKFGTIAGAANSVKQKSAELSEGSRLLADGSKTQSESVEHLSSSVSEIADKITRNTSLASEAAELTLSVQENASAGTEQMGRMTKAAADINNSSQSIAKVIKVIDEIAFQTNILALNAAVEAARAGQHGKGFSVVAEEVRNLANRSAEAAKDTGVLIEDTIQKAALGATIAKVTSDSLEKIAHGVVSSAAIISEITKLSSEQSEDIHRITDDVERVERIVVQNNSIAAQSAGAAGEISDQSIILNELVSQFQLLDGHNSRNGLGGSNYR